MGTTLKDSWNAWSADKTPRVRSVASPGYRRYVIAVLSFVAGMVIGARRRAIFLTSLVLVLHKSGVRKEAYATVQKQDAEAIATSERGTT